MDDYERFKRNILARTGIDLFMYKEEQMKRRLTSLKNKYQAATFDEFFRMMESDPEIMKACLDRMTINVSEFFRNRQRWHVLEDDILPALLSGRSGRFKVWSAACSSGEEAYSLAIVLSRHLPAGGYDILATDLDEKVLAAAERGVYGETSLKELTEAERSRYFYNEADGFRIKPEYRAPIRFKKHNLLADPFESGFDLIVCRNVLIYFTDEAKAALYHKFSNALRPGGVLFVGSTEQIFNPGEYGLESIATFFYRKAVTTGDGHASVPDRPARSSSSGQRVPTV